MRQCYGVTCDSYIYVDRAIVRMYCARVVQVVGWRGLIHSFWQGRSLKWGVGLAAEYLTLTDSSGNVHLRCHDSQGTLDDAPHQVDYRDDERSNCNTFEAPFGHVLKDIASTIMCAGATCTENDDLETCTDRDDIKDP